MQAKMQTRVRCNGRIFLAVCIIFFMGYTAQGVPVQKARFQRVRCRPDISSANCIEEKGPLFEISESGANRILPPKADPFLIKRFQEQPDIFSLYGEESGSGADDIPETESESGSGIDYNVEYPNLSSSGLVQKEEWKQELTNEDLVL
ncbi:serglycin [Gopherus flavomarginatus]|uniref:serglycin n=1 Tax=Gopherus flavomarginatus TaxID=286002 RepID=UPI0021CBF997|nr:serglycin [Gopherus flavomarginatus]